MNLQNVWTGAAIAHAAFALASLTISFAFARRVQLRGRATILLLTLLALTAFFAVASIDAFVHAGAAAPRFTNWTLAAFLLQIAVALLGLHFYTIGAWQLFNSVGESKAAALVPLGFAYFYLSMVFYRWHGAGFHLEWLADGPPLFPFPFFYAFFMSFALMFRQLPKSERSGSFWKMALRTQLPLELVALNLSPQRPAAEPLAIAATALDLRSLGSTVVSILLVSMVSIYLPNPGDLGSISTYTLLQLAMLPGIAGLVYFQTRATFFDLLIKRGAVLAALCLLTIFIAAAVPIVSLSTLSGIDQSTLFGIF